MVLCTFAVGLSFLISFLLINNIVLFWFSKPFLFEFIEKQKRKSLYFANLDDYLKNLDKAFSEDKVYLDPLLSLEKLSRITYIPRNYLSHIINTKYASNFNEFVNKHRIDAVIEKLKENSGREAIINMAYEVGFNSKSTFNTAFKRYKKMTPSEYLSRNVLANIN
jgi:AraC-like DNA-binding protein